MTYNTTSFQTTWKIHKNIYTFTTNYVILKE